MIHLKTDDRKCSVILTLGDLRQKKICKQLLTEYGIDGEVSILCDSSDSARIGSGGAFLNALQLLDSNCRKMIVINAGGFSKRSFCYALEGKAFVERINENEESVLLIEEILLHAKQYARRFEQGVLVVCGDLPVAYEEVDLDFQENIGFCISEKIQTAKDHGVMIPNQAGYLKAFLHKQSESVLESYGAVVPVDTGMLFFTYESALFLKDHFKSVSKQSEISLYADIVPLFEDHMSESSRGYIGGMPYRRMRVCVLHQNFLHYGTNEQIKSHILSGTNDAVTIHSEVSADSVIRPDSVVVDCRLRGNCWIGKDCIVKNVDAENLFVPDHSIVCSFFIRDGSCIAVVTPIHEDPKALKNGQELWKTPRFFKGVDFAESYALFCQDSKQERFSIGYCIENASVQAIYEQRTKKKNLLCKVLGETPLVAMKHDILEDYWLDKPTLRADVCVEDTVRVDLPLRINLAGTWSDAMPYCVQYGGKMVNAAILIDGSLPVSVKAARTNESELVLENSGNRLRCDWKNLFLNTPEDFRIFAAAFKAMGLSADSEFPFGLYLAITTPKLDRGSGLGMSSILMAGIIKACGRVFGLTLTRRDLVLMVFVAEQMLGTGGGWQDQVGAIYTGIKKSVSQPGIRQEVCVNSIPIGPQLRQVFFDRLIIIPTGVSHDGCLIVRDIADRVIDKNTRTLQAIAKNKALCEEMETALRTDQYESFCACVKRHNSLLQEISPKVWSETLESIATYISQFCDALTILGAGGGGYFLGIMKETVNLASVQACYKKEFPSIRSEVYQVQLYSAEQTI